jgi:hypothetical protein
VFGLMLRGHPEIAHAGEMNFLFESAIADDDANLEEYRRILKNDRVFRSTNLKIDPSLSQRELIRSFVSRVGRRDRTLVINVHRNFQRAPEVFPDARYIHLLRDPRDVASSAVKMGWAGNVFYGVDHWINTERDFDALAKLVAPERILTLRHRALILDPEKELARVCRFIGVGYDPAMLEYPKSSTYGPPDASLVNRWKRKLSTRQLGLVEGKLGELLERRGFEGSGAPQLHPGRLGALALKWRNRGGRVAFAFRRYGAFWTCLEILGRKLGMRRLAERAQLAIDNRMLAHLK